MADGGSRIYNLWNVAFSHVFLPRSAVVGAHRDRRLDHRLATEPPARTIHGHPTRNRRANEAIGCWPLSLWLPYVIYRSTHLAHHRDEHLTDPLDDPESYYWAEHQWGALGRLARAIVAAQSTLLGRVTLGPAWTIARFFRFLGSDLRRGKGRTRAIVARHLLECAVVLAWVIGVCGMPFWVYVACFIYPGASLALIRSFAEHRAEKEVGKRTAIVENTRILGRFPVQQPACRASPAPQTALVSSAEILSPQSRRADRGQRRPCLQRLFRRRAALSPDIPRQRNSSRVGNRAA